MRIIEVKDYEEMSVRVADLIAAQLTLKPRCVLGLATGSTPVGAYRRLAELNRAGTVSFAEASSVNLDEYQGLAPEHEQSYRYFMRTNLFDHVDIDPARTHVPGGLAEDAGAECARYDRLIEELGGIDLQLLGLGRNGHIGFNEPGDAFIPGTHVVDLTEDTIDANKRFFASEADVPRRALTMGVGNIMSARRVVIAASGAGKARAVAGMAAGPITPQVPASILQLHPDVVVVADAAALSELKAEEG